MYSASRRSAVHGACWGKKGGSPWTCCFAADSVSWLGGSLRSSAADAVGTLCLDSLHSLSI